MGDRTTARHIGRIFHWNPRSALCPEIFERGAYKLITATTAVMAACAVEILYIYIYIRV